MEIEEIINRNYLSAKRRGQISEKTRAIHFINKIDEEYNELYTSCARLHEIGVDSYDIDELADIVLVCFSMAKHTNKDLLLAIEKKMLFNEKRLD